MVVGSTGGDTFDGSYTPGGGSGVELDISDLTNPTTKNAADLVAYVTNAWQSGWGYVWGTYGQVLTPELFQYKLTQYPEGVGQYADFIRSNWLGKHTADCVGLIKGYAVTPEDDARIREIARERFQSWEQIFGRSPKFTIDRTGRFAGGKVQFKLDVQKGLIRDAAVYGDFFSTLDADTLCAALMGCPYERGAVLAALRSHGIDGAVYRISAEELASVVVD